MTRIGGFGPSPPVVGEPKNQAPFTRPMKPTPAKTPAPSRTVTNPKTPKVSAPALTPEQLAQQAVTASLAPLYAQAQSREQANQAAVAEFTRQLIAQLGNIPALTQADYGQAEAGQSAIAQAAGDALKAANPNASLQQNLAFVGAPGSQQTQVSGQLNNVFNGGGATQMYTGGVLPVGTMAADEAATLANERQLPAIEALRGQQALGQVLGNYQQTVQGLDAQQPDLIQKYVASYTDARQKAAAQNALNAYRSASLGLQAAKAQASATKSSIFGNSTSGYFSINPRTGKVTQITAGTGKPPKVFGSAKSGYFAIDPATGKVEQLTSPVAGASSGGSTHYQSKTINGHTVVFDPSTGSYYLPNGKPANPNTFAKPPKPLSSTISRDITADIRTNKAGGTSVDKKTGQTTVIPPLVDVSKDDPRIDRLYTAILNEYGINEQQAFNLVGKAFPGWAARNKRSFLGQMPGKPATENSGVNATPVNTTAMSAKTLTTVAKMPSAALTPTQAKAAAAQLAKMYGWGPSEMASLYTLWNNESGWNFQAKNPSGGALGIPQALGHQLPANYASNAVTQILWGLNYIKQRYGSPSAALAFWYAPKSAGQPQGHWY